MDISFGSPVVFFSLGVLDIELLDNSHFLMSDLMNNGDQFPFNTVRKIGIAGSVISLEDPVVVPNICLGRISRIDANRVLLVGMKWGVYNSLIGKIISTENSLSFGPEVTLDDHQCADQSVKMIDGGRFVCVYSDYTDENGTFNINKCKGKSILGQVSGNSVAVVSSKIYEDDFAFFSNVEVLNPNTLVISYSGYWSNPGPSCSYFKDCRY